MLGRVASSKAGGESLEGFHGCGAGCLGCVAFCGRCVALQAVVVDASGVLALSVQVAELLDLGGGHGSGYALGGEALCLMSVLWGKTAGKARGFHPRNKTLQSEQRQLVSDRRQLLGSPLFSHGSGYPIKCPAALFPAVRSWRHQMDALLPAGNAVCRA